jgi:hypothetical protein
MMICTLCDVTYVDEYIVYSDVGHMQFNSALPVFHNIADIGTNCGSVD